MALTKITRAILDTGISDSSDATAITIDSNENVGIGTTSPGTILHTRTSDATSNNNAGGGFYHVSSSTAGSRIASVFLDADNGNFSTSSDGAYAYIEKVGGGGNLNIRNQDNSPIAFYQSSSERMRIDSSGNAVFSGDTITVGDGHTFGNGGGDNLHIETSTGENLVFNAAGGITVFQGGGTENARIDSTGALLVGTTSQITTTSEEVLHIENGDSVGQIVLNNTRSSGNQYMVQIRRLGTLVGSIQTSTTATSYVTSSDYRLKENVNYEFDALSRVAQLKPARFNFIVDADKTVDGFLAHEVSDIVPEAITGEKDGEQMQGIDQSKLVPLLTKAIQEQQEIINNLKTRIEALEA
jgi:hypothetical protein|tara:strand:- start:259 stop:1323 length:1065 start_codon:yes stop_codon:yes gene_type:complete